MSKALLLLQFAFMVVTITSGCGSIITKPIGLATQAVFTPVKAVAGTAVDVVSKPVGKAARLVKPVTPVVRIR